MFDRACYRLNLSFDLELPTRTIKTYINFHKGLICAKPELHESGVLQGLLLGPLLFSFHLLPLGSTLRKHGISFHCFAAGSQIYVDPRQEGA